MRQTGGWTVARGGQLAGCGVVEVPNRQRAFKGLKKRAYFYGIFKRTAVAAGS